MPIENREGPRPPESAPEHFPDSTVQDLVTDDVRRFYGEVKPPSEMTDEELDLFLEKHPHDGTYIDEESGHEFPFHERPPDVSLFWQRAAYVRQRRILHRAK